MGKIREDTVMGKQHDKLYGKVIEHLTANHRANAFTRNDIAIVCPDAQYYVVGNLIERLKRNCIIKQTEIRKRIDGGTGIAHFELCNDATQAPMNPKSPAEDRMNSMIEAADRLAKAFGMCVRPGRQTI
jgi:hypothetical protein